MTELPALVGQPKVAVPAGAKQDEEFQNQESTPLTVCSASRGSEVPSLRTVQAARTLVTSAGESHIVYSTLEFPSAQAAQTFVAEVVKANQDCAPVAATQDERGSKPGSREPPAPVKAVVDEGRVVGFQGTPALSGEESPHPFGDAYIVVRKGSVVIISGAGFVGDAAMAARSDFDDFASKPVLEAVATL